MELPDTPGSLIAREAQRRSLSPTLAGRNRQKLATLSAELGLPMRVFGLDQQGEVQAQLADIELVLNCAGPFSSTAASMVSTCILAGVHYLNIIGEIDVFEYVHARNTEAERANIVLCPGVGFDVIPTDCVAAKLKEALPDATHLVLGFESDGPFSPGTAKTVVEGIAAGGRVRSDGKIITVPLAYGVRDINFGNGVKSAMTIPWGDVSTAFHTTGIPNIEVYNAAPRRTISALQRMNKLRWLIRTKAVQALVKSYIGRTVAGPGQGKRENCPTYVWGEVTNSQGQKKTARLRTANGYDVTVTGALAVVEHVLQSRPLGGAYTPAKLVDPGLAERLPGSSRLQIDD